LKYRVNTWWWGRYVERGKFFWHDQDGNVWKYPPAEDLISQKPGWPQWEEYKEELHGKPQLLE